VPLEHGCLLNIIHQKSCATGTRLLIEYNTPEFVCHWNTSLIEYNNPELMCHWNTAIYSKSTPRSLWYYSETFYSKSQYIVLVHCKTTSLLISNTEHCKPTPMCHSNTACNPTSVCRTKSFLYSAHDAMTGAASV